MSELTREQIEHYRELLLITKWTPKVAADINTLCDMALRLERYTKGEQPDGDLLDRIAELERQLAEPQQNRFTRDWPEDAGHENGQYQCQCVCCGHLFIGHKRRVACKVCNAASETLNKLDQRADAAESRLRAVEGALRELVTLKRMKDAQKQFGCPDVCYTHKWSLRDYLVRKPLAWEAARLALSSPPEPQPSSPGAEKTPDGCGGGWDLHTDQSWHCADCGAERPQDCWLIDRAIAEKEGKDV